jgi:hypothetical protein
MVVDLLDRHDRRARAILPRPVDLTVRRVTFGGENRIEKETIPFVLDSPDLSTGLWLVVTMPQA